MPRASNNPPLIRLHAVRRRYHVGTTEVHALDGVTMDIGRGEFVAIVGRSGSGKSTLLHLVAALETPTAGEIEVDSWKLAGLSRRERARYRREMVGLVFQQFNLIQSMDALHNVGLPLLLGGAERSERLRRATAALETVGLADRLHHRPVELSGGEQQRVAVARALVCGAPIVLADEPTGNLDSVTARRMLDLLTEIHRDEGKTVVLVTHSLPDARAVAGRVVELIDGRISDIPPDDSQPGST